MVNVMLLVYFKEFYYEKLTLNIKENLHKEVMKRKV